MLNSAVIFAVLVIFPASTVLCGQKSEDINLYFAGDTVVSTHTIIRIKEKNNSDIWGKLVFLKNADVFMLNLEAPLTERTEKIEKKFNFQMSAEFAGILKSNHVDIVNLANNHIYDYGPDGVVDTIVNLDKAGLHHVGAGSNLAEARKPVILEAKGAKFGFLGCYGLGLNSAKNDKPGVCPRLEEIILKDISELKRKVDYVIVNVHWGEEKKEVPEKWQIGLAHQMVDKGADFVIGHHSHVLQGMEWYKGAFIAYSLGNFLFTETLTKIKGFVILQIKINENKTIAKYIPVRFRKLRAETLKGKNKDEIIGIIYERTRKLIQAPAN